MVRSILCMSLANALTTNSAWFLLLEDQKALGGSIPLFNKNKQFITFVPVMSSIVSQSRWTRNTKGLRIIFPKHSPYHGLVLGAVGDNHMRMILNMHTEAKINPKKAIVLPCVALDGVSHKMLVERIGRTP